MPQVLCAQHDFHRASNADLLTLLFSNPFTEFEAVAWGTNFRSFAPAREGLDRFLAGMS